MINIMIWTLLGLYLASIITIRIPAVQRFIGNKAAAVLSQHLGTSVRLGRVDLGFFNRIIADDVLIFDQQHKQMLKAHRISAKIEVLPLTEGKISITAAQVFGAHALLYKANRYEKPNYQFLIDSLASNDTTKQTPLNLRINSLIVRHSSIKYDCYDQPATPRQLNLSHLNVSDVSAHIILKTLTSDSVNINVKKLAFNEQCGLRVDRLAFRFEGGRKNCHLQQFQLALPHSNINIDDLEAQYVWPQQKAIEKETITCKGHIDAPAVTPSDFSALMPALQSFQHPLSLSTSFHGKDMVLSVSHFDVSSATNDIVIALNGNINYQEQQPRWNADVRQFSVSSQTIQQLKESFKQQSAALDIAERLGNIKVSGQFSGTALSAFDTKNTTIATDIGQAAVNASLTANQHFEGHIETTGIQLGQLLNNDKWGTIATDIKINGEMPDNGNFKTNINGVVAQLEYNNYCYKNITLEGLYSANDINGHFFIDDPHVHIDATGAVVRHHHTNDIQVAAAIRHLSPQAINISDQWGDASFDADLHADFSASSLNDAVGSVDIKQLAMTSSKDHYHLNKLEITSGFDNGIHFVTLASDFAEAKISGYFDYNTITGSITNFIGSKLPTLPGMPAYNPSAKNNFTVQAQIESSDWLQKLLGIPLQLQQPATINGSVNDHTRQIVFNGEFPQFLYNNEPYHHATIRIDTPNDSLHYDLAITKEMDNGDNFDLQLQGNAFDNHLTTMARWNNHADKKMSGLINTKAHFYTNHEGKQMAQINMMPSVINIHDTIWSVKPCNITYAKQYLHIDNFAISHDDQHLQINGTASHLPSDSLSINLHDINVEYVLDLVNFHSVDFNGFATGDAYLCSAFDTPKAHAKLRVDQFQFQHGRMGTLFANADWNQDEKQIDIDAIANDGLDAMTYVNGYISPSKDYIDLDIRAAGTHIDFVHSFTKSFMSDVKGHANGAVRLYGPLSTINLTGQLVINGETSITPLGCTYTLRNDTIRLIPDEITFDACPVFDKYNHRAVVNGALHHKHLTRLSYDLYVNADNLLAYDFSNFGDNTFYGTIYGTGNVGIHGKSDETIFDISITPQKNSTFIYNVSNPDAIVNQEFIQWNHMAPLSNDTTRYNATPLIHRSPSNTQSLRDIPSDLRLDFMLDCTPDVTIKLLMDSRTNDYITLQGNGILRATYHNKSGFNIFGTYRVVHGTYGITIQDIIKKNFTFNEGGTIVFGGDPYDANLNLQAVHTVNGVSLSDLNVGRSFSNTVRVNCLMNISGQAKAPHVDFDLDIPNVNSDEKQMVRSIINGEEEMNQQVLYLLGIGRFYPQGSNNATTQEESSQSQTSLAMQSLLSGTLSTQINNVLKSVIKSNDWNFGANISTGDEGWHNAEYEGLLSGRLFNNRLLINGQFGYRDNATTATSSFIGDFDIRYLLLPNGNLSVKVYNQTNDRYFTKSSLNTQGIGIIMKKDFNGLHDLFGRKKKAASDSTQTIKATSDSTSIKKE